MGNKNSTEENVVGGFLVGLGTILSFTPIAIATSSWMIPVGGRILTGKDQPVGAGATYSNDGKGVQVHIGNPDNFLRQREYFVNKEIQEKNNVLQQKELQEQKLNESIKTFIIDYNYCFDQFKRKQDLYFYYPKIKVFEFNNKKYLCKSAKYANNLYCQIDEYICTNNDVKVDRIHVIRRNLGSMPFNVGWLAHSGLLLQTTKGEYYICEYGVEKNKNEVSCYKIDAKDVDILDKPNFTHKGKTWKKQLCGHSVSSGNITVGKVHNTMMDIAWQQKYSMLFWNCHMAQEKTREELGLEVNAKYLNKELADELEVYNSAGF